ncbi:anthranilate synthase component I [bacterium]|nr:anthranilate synthase component I [bacterium]
MFYPDFKEFKRLSKKGNLIPVYKEILADLETPVSALAKISGNFKEKYCYLLESVENGERLGRYSFLSTHPSFVFESKGKQIKCYSPGGKYQKKIKGNPIDELRRLMKIYKPVEIKGLPLFYGGAVGFVGYDLVRFVEDIPDVNPDSLNLPDCLFLFTNNILVFDHISHMIKVVSCVHLDDFLIKGDKKNRESIQKKYTVACQQIDEIIKKLRKNVPLLKKKKLSKKIKLKIKSNFNKKEFEDIVKKAKKHIKAGEIIQTVLSQRLSVKINTDSFNIYRALRVINPSPYMFYLKMDKYCLVGSSPEILVRKEERTAELRPIAGTRKRGVNEQEDLELIKSLLADPKERAEHIMLVDLGRNDLGRVCKYDTVNVTELMTIEKYSHVMHIVSDIKGRLKKDVDSFDLFCACFPAGTVSGAPKIRAMEIIDQLENVRRGTYAGAVGYFSFQGNMDMAITIRTILIKDRVAYIQAGAGIVYDSLPQKEYKETLNKAKAMIKAVQMAEEGFE